MQDGGCWYNLGVRKKHLWLFFFVLAAVLSGCNTSDPADVTQTPTATQKAAVTPYATQTLQATSTLVATVAPTSTLPPLPSATPFLYTVVENDTLISIAINFGITLDELSIANPEVNANFLSVGTQLVIPLPTEEGEEAQTASEPQVLPLATFPPVCYPAPSGGMWCYWQVKNTLEVPVENIAGLIRLYDAGGEEVAIQTASPLLNVLPPGAQMPLQAYFSAPLPEWTEIQGQLVSAVEANQYAARYVDAQLQNLQTAPITDGLQEGQGVLVSGEVVLPTGEDGTVATPEYIWVLVLAYDGQDTIVGVRRWEAPEDLQDTGALLPFEIQVFTLERPIDHVEILVEMRPAVVSSAN